MSKTAFCAHDRSCLGEVLWSCVKLFTCTTSIRVVWSTCSRKLLGRGSTGEKKKGSRSGFSKEFGPEIRFGLFIATSVSLVKLFNCFLRYVRKTEDKWNGILSGALSGISLLFCEKRTREEVGLLMFVRAFSLFTSMALASVGIKVWPYTDILLCCVFCAINQWAVVYSPTLVHYSFYNFIFSFSSPVDKDMFSYLRELSYAKRRSEERPEEILQE
eukprot:TRINITY_DN10515_c0_g1_i3.p1 TRINITY_DN10515_c0_g1~~TRINITY_DN10515_c0_g1_i3.p1  ORF type:complete len:216 (+),score=21.45 TRINITY_DN10515_c0_g1_i3:44-691(+)